MNGWQRLGVVLTAVWIGLVASYAAYERSFLPVSVFTEETEPPPDGFVASKALYFVDLNSDSRNTQVTLDAMQRQLNAKTPEEQRAAVEDIRVGYTTIFTTS